MSTPKRETRLRFWFWLIRLIGVIVPRKLRADWKQEWRAELQYREGLLAEWDRLHWKGSLDLLRRSLGAFWDALWFQQRRWEDDMLQDLRFGARMLFKNPGFTSIAIISLALGIGANTAIFQLIDAIRLRTLPISHPDELAEVRIKDMTGARGTFIGVRPTVTNPIWEQIRDRHEGFSGLVAWSHDRFNLATGGEARYAQALWVSGEFFDVIGITPALGRFFNSGDDQRECNATAVISFSFWQREFGGDPAVIGKRLTLDSHPAEIIGVAPADFFGLEIGQSFDVATPICSEAAIRGASNRLSVGTQWWLTIMGRLQRGWTYERACAELESISPEIFRASLPGVYPATSVNDYLAMKLAAVPAAAGVSQVRETYERPLWLLLAISGLVLLIACTNLANLMLARASAREREMAVRLALGASRGRLIRQLLTESLLLAFAGASIGALLAQSLSKLLISFLSTQGNQVFVALPADWRVLGFTAALGIGTSILFGLTPALRATSSRPGTAMKAAGRGLTANRERFTARRLLIVSQVALSLVLLVGALLFTRSLTKLLTIDAGFRQEGILIARYDFTRLNLNSERRQQVKRDLLDRIRALPQVDAAAGAYIVPISGDVWGNRIWLDGADSDLRRKSSFNRITSDYFKTLGTPLLAGRDFDDHDAPNAPKVAIVNEAFARDFVNGSNPVGQRFWVETTTVDIQTRYEIVGLVKNAKYNDLRARFEPVAFLPESQNPRPTQFGQMLIHSNASSAELVASVARAIGEVSPEIGIESQVFETQIRDSLLRERLMATLSGFFGGLALLLACIGLYGMLSYGVASRTNEIGIRMALGAQPRNVFWLILQEAVLLVLIGIVVGFPVALGATRLVSTLLFDLTPSDPVSIGLGALSLFTVALAAGYLPARRATRVDPMIALRSE